MNKIMLLDSNPYKVENCCEWYKRIKPIKEFSKIESEYLKAGLEETQENLNLYKRSDTFTVKEALEEMYKFYDVIKRKINYLDLNQKRNGKIRGRARENRKRLNLILTGRYFIEKNAENSIYSAETLDGYKIIYEITKKATEEVTKKRRKRYSQTDAALATTALVRAYNDLETSITTPDGDISQIIKKSFENMLFSDSLGVFYFDKAKEKISIDYSYKGSINDGITSAVEEHEEELVLQ